MSDCKLRIQIENGAINDIISYGFYLVKSPSELALPIKESNIIVTDFPDEDGVTVYIPPIPAKKEFDYPIELLYFSTSLPDANQKIHDFYESLVGKKITLYNDLKGVMVIGYVKGYKDVSFYRNEKDVVIFELNFLIPKPNECNFKL